VWSAIDVLLVPSLGLESYGLVVEEAIARGVPVVASSRGALPGRLREGGGLLFDPDEAGALARRIGELIADPAELAALAPRRAVRGIAEHGAEIDAVYDEVLARRGRS
jgi:glycosyltransferase involved in cell wall biosynthesis